MNQVSQMRVGCRSVTGGRAVNEDRCFADPSHGMLLVVDGMGGHQGGAEASRIIEQTLPAVVEKTLAEKELAQTDADHSNRDPSVVQEAVDAGVQAARDEILRFAERRPGFDRMGATLAIVLADDHALYVSHIGDCRAYRFHQGRLERLTTDQTFVQAMVESGHISEAAAKTHPWRHIVLNALGVRELEQAPEVTVTPLASGDRILLATDGLTEAVDDDALRGILSRPLSPQAAADELVRQALEHKSKDNVTCIVADVA